MRRRVFSPSELWRFGQDTRDRGTLFSEEEAAKAIKRLQERSSEFHNLDLQYTSAAEMGELRSRHNIVYRNWSYKGKLKVGENVDIHHCLPNRMHFVSVSRSSPEAASLPPSFSKIPAMSHGSHTKSQSKDYAKEVKEIMQLMRPEMRAKANAKVDVNDDIKSNLSGLLLGRTHVQVTKSPTSSSAALRSPKGFEPEMDDDGICLFAQEILDKSKCDNLVEAFRVLDSNGSGRLSLSEFELGLYAMNIAMDKDESRRVFKWLDMDKQGTISLSEWNRLDFIIKMLKRSGRFHKREKGTDEEQEQDDQERDFDDSNLDSDKPENPTDMKTIAGQRRAAIVQGLDLGFTKKLIQWKKSEEPW